MDIKWMMLFCHRKEIYVSSWTDRMISGRIVPKEKQQKIILKDFIASLEKNHNLRKKYSASSVMGNLSHRKSIVLRKNQEEKVEEGNRTSKPSLKKVNISLFQKEELSASVEDLTKAKMIWFSVMYVKNGIITNVLGLLDRKRMLRICNSTAWSAWSSNPKKKSSSGSLRSKDSLQKIHNSCTTDLQPLIYLLKWTSCQSHNQWTLSSRKRGNKW